MDDGLGDADFLDSDVGSSYDSAVGVAGTSSAAGSARVGDVPPESVPCGLHEPQEHLNGHAVLDIRIVVQQVAVRSPSEMHIECPGSARPALGSSKAPGLAP
jgi:hypothetical protein